MKKEGINDEGLQLCFRRLTEYLISLNKNEWLGNIKNDERDKSCLLRKKDLKNL